MGFLGDFAKIILYLTVASWILTIIMLFVTGQTGLATLLLVGFIIPLSMVAYEYIKNRKKAN